MVIKSYDDIVELISRRRKHLKISVNEIAEVLDIARPNASKIVNGKSQLRFDQLLVLLKRLGVELETKAYQGSHEEIEKRALELQDEVESLEERLLDKDSRVKLLEILLTTAKDVLTDKKVAEVIAKDDFLVTNPLLKQVLDLKL